MLTAGALPPRAGPCGQGAAHEEPGEAGYEDPIKLVLKVRCHRAQVRVGKARRMKNPEKLDMKTRLSWYQKCAATARRTMWARRGA